MKRVILDTNIYGLIAVDLDKESIRSELRRQSFIIYGLPVVRKELRNTKRIFVDGINLRSDLLGLYHELTKDREINVGSNENSIASNYFTTYRGLGGIRSMKQLYDDLLIVAAASSNKLDVVVSEDNATMINDLMERVYSIVNSTLRLKTPRFIGYDEFKKEIKK